MTNLKSSGLRCRGSFQVFDKDSGTLLFENHNMWTTLGLSAIANWIAGAEGTHLIPSKCSVGNSNSPVSMGQTALLGTVLGTKPFDSAIATGTSIKFISSFFAGEASGVWEEVGIFDTSDLMWSRALTGTYTKKELDKIEVHWTYELFDNSESV